MLSSNTSAVSGDTKYIEDYFSSYLYTGNGTSQTITNGVDLATKGGFVWIKDRTSAYDHMLFDTARGADYTLRSNTTDPQYSQPGRLSTFNTNGFSIGNGNVYTNGSGDNYVSWSFAKATKFFDVVTYTGNGAASRNIAHSLGATPGCIISKPTSTTGPWGVYHRSTGANGLYLNATNSAGVTLVPTGHTSTTFEVADGYGLDNVNGVTYVSYIFAHDAGGFGLTGTDNVISCGSYTGNGSTQTVSLGYEPQYILYKQATGTAGNWMVFDSMRGLTMGTDAALYPNASNAEEYGDAFNPTATGFGVTNNAAWNASGQTYIYIAIRRGPMKVPTDGTKVFRPAFTGDTDSSVQAYLGKPVDLWVYGGTRSSPIHYWRDRMRGGGALESVSTAAEFGNAGQWYASNIGANTAGPYSNNNTQISWVLARAPSFFDEVCYTSTSNTSMTLTHNLGVAPEMMIKKARATNGTSNSWRVYHTGLNGGVTPQNCVIRLDDSGAQTTSTPDWNYTAPTSTQFTAGFVESGITYVTYLFATCAGVSKVGSYTGTGTTKQVDCGFAAGARFVLIKRTDSTGDWYVWDTARGIVSGNDPYLLLNSTAAEVTTTDYIDTYSAGFELSSTAPAAINASGGTFLYLAIA